VIHYSELVGTLRFYTQTTGDPYGEMADYVGVCTVMWETADIVYLVALRADMTRAMQRELLEWLVERGVKRVKAHRAPGRSLPFARRVDDHEEIEVADLVERFKVAGVPKPHHRAGEAPPVPCGDEA
jgi:hypothetical protein